MSLKSIIASLVLGSSSVAMASPAITVQARGSVSVGASAYYPTARPLPPVRGRVSSERDTWMRDHRHRQPVVLPAPTYPAVDHCENISGSYYRGPVGQMPTTGHASIALTAPTRIENGREIIEVGPSRGLFTQLTLRASRGATFIRSVEIVLSQHEVQTVRVNQWLDSRNPTISFAVDNRRGRMIGQIMVNGQSEFGSRYVITSER